MKRNVTSVTDRVVTGRKRYTAGIAITPAEILNSFKLTNKRLSTCEERRKEKTDCQDVSSITSAKNVINYWIQKNIREKLNEIDISLTSHINPYGSFRDILKADK